MQRKPHIFFIPVPDAEYMVLFVERFMAREGSLGADRLTHTTTTVTLAAHAHRGLIITVLGSSHLRIR